MRVCGLLFRRVQSFPLWTHVVIISTFPFLLSIMLISTPSMINGLVAFVPTSGLLGFAGFWLARRRGIRAENKFLSLMLISFGLAAATIAPTLITAVTGNSLPPLLAAAFLYGVTLVIYLMLVFGLYGLTINFHKPEYHLVGA